MKAPRGTLERRSFLFFGAASLFASGCTSDGHLSILGYTSRPQYDTTIKTVYVPIFKNKAFQTGPSREEEMALTREVIKQIELKTPYKVVSDPDRADTELKGTILRFQKNLANRNQQNEVREIELVMVIEVVWRDLKTGKVLSNPAKSSTELPGPGFDPRVAPVETGPEKAMPVTLTSTGRALPEVGESNATAQQAAMSRLAVKVAQLMESPWNVSSANCPR
ncbi:LptE family protein [Telmatocola sphagniphila]|uniref:LptE family protein n=1 Tax=Telmatocola sphagniphila TaxID=1123043 RepID=A0A8E6B6S2_9BACT|nr:LptE family protein [Telmatocola sphagniphila]QVL32761.1 LptE family protein [Telmatocola sphagniphila]